MLTSCPGTVDQKKPLQSGSSNIYGTKRVKSRTQFKTENRKKKVLSQSKDKGVRWKNVIMAHHTFILHFKTKGKVVPQSCSEGPEQPVSVAL